MGKARITLASIGIDCRQCLNGFGIERRRKREFLFPCNTTVEADRLVSWPSVDGCVVFGPEVLWTDGADSSPLGGRACIYIPIVDIRRYHNCKSNILHFIFLARHNSLKDIGSRRLMESGTRYDEYVCCVFRVRFAEGFKSRVTVED